VTRAEQRTATRASILRLSAEEFNAKGYAGTSISDISTRLGMTKGAIYFHFPAKANIAIALVEQLFTAWEPLKREAVQDGRVGLAALKWISHQIAVSYRDDVMVSAAVRLNSERALIDGDLPEPYVGWIEFASIHLARAQGAGEVRADLDVERLAYQFVAAFEGTQEVSHQLSNRKDIEDRIDAMWEVFERGVTP
jgi:AcrR family transcriptional regulator